MRSAARMLGEFASALRADDIPLAVLDTAALHALDTVGCGLAAHATGEVRWARSAVEEGSLGAATVIGRADGASPADAALVNGTLCHALDFDDTHPSAIVHASAVIVPTALAVGEALGRSGREVLAAVVAGYEVAIRLGMAAGTAFHARGLHSTGVCGVFGAAATAANLRGLDATRTAHALGLAASMASGTLEFLADGAQTKPLHAGWAAHGGVVASRFAENGAQGPGSAIDGARGLFATYLHGMSIDVDSAIADLGDTWETPNLAYKLHPVCHYIHAPLDALAELQRQRSLTPEDVRSVVVLADEITIALVLDPLAEKRVPRTPYDAKFSLPYCLASQLVRGHLDVSSFTEAAVANPEVQRVAESIDYERHDFGTTVNEMIGAVRVTLADGSVVQTEPRRARGHADHPIEDADVVAKFHANATAALDWAHVAAVERGVRAMARGGDLGWVAALRAPSCASST